MVRSKYTRNSELSMFNHLSFSFKRPQQLAALLLLLLLAQCLWVVRRQSLTTRDYDFARCGREMWEKPSPLAGYFTTCGNIHDGTLGYRVAGFPLTVQRIMAKEGEETSTWEMRHELNHVLLLLHGAFIFVGLCLGAALWWVTRRLYGNTGGFVALALYCFCPPVIHACTYPNNEILASLGIFASIYTAVGVAHAMQGPRRKWRPRIVLLAFALGVTAAAHVSAFLLTIVLAIVFMAYLAEGYRASVIPVMGLAIGGSLLLVFASYAFSPDAFSYYFRSSAGEIGFSLMAVRDWFLSLSHAAITIGAITALLLYLLIRRSRYFGNTFPLLIAVLLFPLVTPGTASEPALWALPFLLAFIAGVFADILETRHRPVFLWVTGSVLVLEILLSFASLPSLAA
jgi:hypothetical protein